ncbi:MAG: hypothetical protein WDM94_00885 [Bauldia sp.]
MSKEARALLLVAMDVEPEYEEEFNRWYWEEHLPERLAIEGFLDAKRYVAVEGAPKYLAIYELESADVLRSDGYTKAAAQSTPWTTRMRQHYRFTRNIYVEIENPKSAPAPR